MKAVEVEVQDRDWRLAVLQGVKVDFNKRASILYTIRNNWIPNVYCYHNMTCKIKPFHDVWVIDALPKDIESG